MHTHFSRKSALFYGITLGFVALLFHLVTRYGESHLQAPPNLNGRYVSDKSFPGCPSATRLALEIRQSGIYLSGSLRLLDSAQTASESAPAASEEKPSLNGLWQSQRVMLSGTTPALVDCQTAADNAAVNIQGSLVAEPAGFDGKIALGNTAPIAFTAQREAVAPPPKH